MDVSNRHLLDAISVDLAHRLRGSVVLDEVATEIIDVAVRSLHHVAGELVTREHIRTGQLQVILLACHA